MRRWEMDDIGRENLTLREVPQPEPPPGQVLVEVAAVSRVEAQQAEVPGQPSQMAVEHEARHAEGRGAKPRDR